MKCCFAIGILLFSHLCLFAQHGEYGAWVEVNGRSSGAWNILLIIAIIVVVAYAISGKKKQD